MYKSLAVPALLLLCSMSSPASAQDAAKIIFNKECSFSFEIPAGMDIYTPDHPGPLKPLFKKGSIATLVNPTFHDENISIVCSEDQPVSEAALREVKSGWERNPKLPLPGYRRITLKFVNVGKKADKVALEHVYNMQGNVSGTINQVILSHREKGIIITCGTSTERYPEFDQKIIEPFLSSLSFK